jgi:hypothetical protein
VYKQGSQTKSKGIRKLHKEEFHNLQCLLHIVRIFGCKRRKYIGYIAHQWRNEASTILWGQCIKFDQHISKIKNNCANKGGNNLTLMLNFASVDIFGDIPPT